MVALIGLLIAVVLFCSGATIQAMERTRSKNGEGSDQVAQYSIVATRAAQLLEQKIEANPEKAWANAAKEIIRKSKKSQEKFCPKLAFIGLCEKGLIQGFERNPEATPDRENKKYAIKAVEILQQHGNINKDELWDMVTDEFGKIGLKHNEQMDVVVALWENGWIKKESTCSHHNTGARPLVVR
jgi:Ribonuclease G/E